MLFRSPPLLFYLLFLADSKTEKEIRVTTKDNIMVDQSQTVLPSPVLLSTAKALTLLGQSVPVRGPEVPQHQLTGRSEFVPVLGTQAVNRNLLAAQREACRTEMELNGNAVPMQNETWSSASNRKNVQDCQSIQGNSFITTFATHLDTRVATNTNSSLQHSSNNLEAEPSTLENRHIEPHFDPLPTKSNHLVARQLVQTGTGDSHRPNTSMGSTQYKLTNQVIIPEYPQLFHRRPTARKCIAKQFANMVVTSRAS